VVTMNSTVVCSILRRGETRDLHLGIPEKAMSRGPDFRTGAVGTAMLGYEAGDIFEWEVPAGKRRLKVERFSINRRHRDYRL